LSVCFIQVGVLDIDICGPSQPRVLGALGEQIHQSGSGWSPVVSTFLKTELSLKKKLLHNIAYYYFILVYRR